MALISVNVLNLSPLMAVDLEGDAIADNPMAEFEFAEVHEVHRETPECVVVYTSQGSWGFPVDHSFKAKPHFVECGSCGHFHRFDFGGDCRDNSNRFTADEVEAMEHHTMMTIEDQEVLNA